MPLGSDDASNKISLGKYSSLVTFTISATFKSSHLTCIHSPCILFQTFLMFSSSSDLLRLMSSIKSFIALTINTNDKGSKMFGIPSVTEIVGTD